MIENQKLTWTAFAILSMFLYLYSSTRIFTISFFSTDPNSTSTSTGFPAVFCNIWVKGNQLLVWISWFLFLWISEKYSIDCATYYQSTPRSLLEKNESAGSFAFRVFTFNQIRCQEDCPCIFDPQNCLFPNMSPRLADFEEKKNHVRHAKHGN